METTGFSPPCSAETSGQATSSGSYNPPLPPAKAPRGAEETKTARSAAAPAIALAHLAEATASATVPTRVAEASASHAMVVEQSPSVSSVTVRSSDEELDILAAAEAKGVEGDRALRGRGETTPCSIAICEGIKGIEWSFWAAARKSARVRKTMREEIAARELVASSGEPGQALSSGNFRRGSIAKDVTAKAGAPEQANNLLITQNVLNQNCVTESWRSVQSEVRLE